MNSIKRNNSLRFEITLVITTLIVAISFAITSWHYFRAKSDYRQQLRSHLEEMAGSVARCIDADQHAKLRKPEDMETEVYSNLYLKLLNLKEGFKNVRYIYTMRLVDNKVYYVIDADNNPENAIALGEEYDGTDESFLNTVSNLRRPASDENFTKDRWGTWLSGYAPIITSEEVADGFVGVDIAADHVIEKENALLRTAVMQLLASLLIAIICGQVVGNFFATPIERMILRMKRIRQGHFEGKLATAGSDELGELTDQINLVSAKVSGQIESLEKKLEIEKQRAENCQTQTSKILDLLRHSATPFLLLKHLTVVDCNQAAIELFKTTHRINLISRQWSELSAEASGDTHLLENIGAPFLWTFFDLTGEPFPHLIELSKFGKENETMILVCFVKYAESNGQTT